MLAVARVAGSGMSAMWFIQISHGRGVGRGARPSPARPARARNPALLLSRGRSGGDPRSDRGPSDSIRKTVTGRSEAAVTGWLAQSVMKAHAPHVKARRAVAQPWRESGCRATESGPVDRVPAWLVAVAALQSRRPDFPPQ